MMQTVGPQGYTPAQMAPSASAVNIQIFEPKAYAPQQQAQPQGPIWGYPTQSMYAPQMMPNQYQQFIPGQQVYTPAPQQYAPFAPQAPQAPVMPAPVLTPEVATQAPAPAPAVAPQPEFQTDAPIATTQTEAPAVEVTPPTEQAQNAVDVDALIAGLQSTDNLAQEDAITKIANLSQGEPDVQNAVLTEPIMNELANIVRQDTSALAGPTEAQTAAINKAATGAELTPEEQALTQQLAPKTAADKNRVISMFTLAMLQKNQRDEIDRYNQTQDQANQLPQLKVNDLIGYNEIENAARNDNEKEVKLAAIQALSYVARPEDKETIEPVLQSALNDSEPLIQQAANEVLANIGSNLAQAPADTQQEAVDVSKMSKKERKAYEKAQKEAAKQAA